MLGVLPLCLLAYSIGGGLGCFALFGFTSSLKVFLELFLGEQIVFLEKREFCAPLGQLYQNSDHTCAYQKGDDCHYKYYLESLARLLGLCLVKF